MVIVRDGLGGHTFSFAGLLLTSVEGGEPRLVKTTAMGIRIWDEISSHQLGLNFKMTSLNTDSLSTGR